MDTVYVLVHEREDTGVGVLFDGVFRSKEDAKRFIPKKEQMDLIYFIYEVIIGEVGSERVVFRTEVKKG